MKNLTITAKNHWVDYFKIMAQNERTPNISILGEKQSIENEHNGNIARNGFSQFDYGIRNN